MSNFFIYINLSPMVRQWATEAFGNPMRFPDGSRENACILRNTIKRPQDTPVDCGGNGEIPVHIPDSKHHSPLTYNHMTAQGKQELVAYIEALFTINWQNELIFLVNDPVDMRASIRAYLSRHGMSLDHEDALLRRFGRWLRRMDDHGLRFRKTKKKKVK